MTTINTPKGPVSFPDGMSDAQIESILQREFPPPPPALSGSVGHQSAGATGADFGALAPLGPAPPPRTPTRSPGADVGISFASHVPRTLASVLTQAGASAPGTPSAMAGLGQNVADLAGFVFPGVGKRFEDFRHGLGPVANTPSEWGRTTQPAADAGTLAVMNPWPWEHRQGRMTAADLEPQTPAGRYGATAGDFVGATLAGGGSGGWRALASRLGVGAASGVASQGAGDLAGDAAAAHSAPETAARNSKLARVIASTVAGVVPGFVGGGVLGGPPAIDEQVARLTPEMHEPEIQAIGARMRANQEAGFPTTGPETTDTITGGASKLGGMQREIETKPAGIEHIGRMMAERPERARNIIAQVLDSIGPQRNPTEIGPAAQTAAQGALDTTRQGINTMARPYYDALSSETIPSEQMKTLAADPSYRAALAQIRGDAELNGPIANLPDNNLAVVNQVVKQLDTRATAARQTVMNPGGDNFLSGLRTGARSNAATLASQNSPNWTIARAIESVGRRTRLDPMEAGPVGKIAGTAPDAPETMTGALYPPTPFGGQAAVTADAVRQLGPSGADLTRAHIERQANHQLRDLANGPNTYAPAKLAAALGGNPERKATLLAGVDAASPSASGKLASALTAFETSGARYPVGSPTVDKLEESMQEAGEHMGVAAIANSSKRMLMDRTLNVFNDLQLEVSQKRIAQAITADPHRWMEILRQAETARGNAAMTRASRQAALSFIAANSGKKP